MLESGPLSEDAFPEFAKSVVPFAHVTSRVDSDPYQDLLQQKGGCGFPMGPFALLDLVGLDTSVAILDALYDEFRDPNYAAVPTLRRKLAAGQLGRKSGRGFFDYS